MKDKILKKVPLFLQGSLVIVLGLLVTMKGWLEKYFDFVDNQTAVFYAIAIMTGLIIFAIILQVIKIAKILIDKRFEETYLQNLRVINYLLIAIHVCFLLLLLITKSFLFVLLIFGFLILNCLLIALQEVFKQAINLQEEADGTI